MKDEKKFELEQNVNERYESYSSDLKKEFAAKLELLKQKYKVLTDSERESLVIKLKQNQSNWKEISSVLTEDKKQVLRRNEEIRVLQNEYNKSVEDLKARKEAELNAINTQYQHDNIVAYRDKNMQQLKSGFEEKVNELNSLIHAKSQEARKCQEYIAAKKDKFEKAKAKIQEKYAEKFRQLCEEHKDDADFTKSRVIIPKELLNVSDENFSISQEDLDKCVVTSKKEISFNLLKEKSNKEIDNIYEEYKKVVEEKIEQLNKVNEELQNLKRERQQTQKKYNEETKNLLDEVSKMVTEKGVGKIEKYSTNKKASSRSKTSYKVPESKNSFLDVIKNSSIYKMIKEKINKSREEKIQRFANENIALNNRGMQSANTFFANLYSEVEVEPTYVVREKDTTKTKQIVK